jgi:homoserine O-acetyltransferase
MSDGETSASFIETQGGVMRFPADKPLRLDSGGRIEGLEVAYNTYGRLNEDRSNAVLVCHALSGDQYAASPHPATGKPGWWAQVIGPGLPLDTDRYFVISTNVVGGCQGTTGPSSIDPATGEPYGLKFPMVTLADMVRAQAMLLDALEIEKLYAAVGGSMGGMQAVLGRLHRLRGAALGAEHRVPRSRPPGDHGRSGLARRRLRPPGR